MISCTNLTNSSKLPIRSGSPSGTARCLCARTHDNNNRFERKLYASCRSGSTGLKQADGVGAENRRAGRPLHRNNDCPSLRPQRSEERREGKEGSTESATKQ